MVSTFYTSSRVFEVLESQTKLIALLSKMSICFILSSVGMYSSLYTCIERLLETICTYCMNANIHAQSFLKSSLNVYIHYLFFRSLKHDGFVKL